MLGGRGVITLPGVTIFLLVSLFALLTVTSTWNNSFTMDEFDNVFSGYRAWKTGDFSFRDVNPPLVRLYVGLPWLFLPDVSPIPEDPLVHKRAFIERNLHTLIPFHRASKILNILVGVMGCFIIFHLGTLLWNERAGLGALFCYVVHPTLLAHAGLGTVDFPFSILNLLVLLLLWKWREEKSPRRAVLLGFALGALISAKFSGLILLPFVLGWMVYEKARPREWAIILLLPIFIVNLTYGFKGTFHRARSFRPMKSTLMRGTLHLLPPFTPIPLPEEYVRGFDRQMSLNAKHFPQYLLGKWRDRPVISYFPFAFGFKTPLLLLLLFLVGLFTVRPVRTLLFIAIPMLLFLGAMSATAPNIGVRYVLPILLFSTLPAGYTLSRLGRRGAVAVVTVLLAVNFIVWPHYLTFFTCLSRGAAHGNPPLLDSNVDWGQDLPLLRRFMSQRGIHEVNLLYFGNIDPRIYGIEHYGSPLTFREGTWAVSLNLLKGFPFTFINGRFTMIPPGLIKAIRDHGPPTAVLGHTIIIFSPGGAKP